MDENEKKLTAIVGYIYTTKGRPIAGASVKCDRAEKITLFDGSYKFQVDPGWHIINVYLEGFMKQEKEIFIEENEEMRLDIQLEENIGDSKIYGYITDKETGKHIVDGMVFIIRPTSNRNSKIDLHTGYYEFNELTSGTYNVWTSIIQYKDEKFVISIGQHESIRHDFQVMKKEDEEVPWG